MAKYDVTVDTRDMANKIDTVSNKVSGVTTAVVAMEAAVIAAERDATNKLCKRLNKGFFSLVTSQIEQKNATALSSVNAYASELIQQQEALLDLKKRMGDDFVILTERYSKLFRGLDVALHNRVHELDKPVIRFCEWDVAITLNRLNNLIGTVPVNQTESLATTQAIAAAHIKRNAQALIAQMTNFLTTCKQQSAKMQRIKLNSFVGKSVLRYLPAIMLVKKGDRGEVVETKLPSGLEQLIGQRSCTKIRENMERTVEGSGWENVSIESQRMVAGKLERLIATSDLNERVKENMKKLMARNETWLNVKEGLIMGGRRHILHDVIRKSETVTLTVGDKSASKTVVLEEPIDIYLEIDDNPYNSSVHDCSKHIESLRNSVVACNAAEVAHKIASTQQIGKHISKGFLGYITASLDMQNMEECSNVEAVVAELQSQSDELANRKLVMIDDYDILTTRYSAVFENLDRELVQRIHMLMEPCFRFVESSRKEQLRNTDSSLSAMALVGHKEQLDVQARISAITVKQRAAGLIESAKQYLLGQKQLASHIEHVLIGGCKNARWMLPVVVVEKTVAGGSKETEVVMNEQTARMGVNDWKVRQNVQQASMPAMTQEDKQRIGKHLEREIQRLGSSEHEKRVAGMMRKLAGNFLS